MKVWASFRDSEPGRLSWWFVLYLHLLNMRNQSRFATYVWWHVIYSMLYLKASWSFVNTVPRSAHRMLLPIRIWRFVLNTKSNSTSTPSPCIPRYVILRWFKTLLRALPRAPPVSDVAMALPNLRRLFVEARTEAEENEYSRNAVSLPWYRQDYAHYISSTTWYFSYHL